MQSSILRYLVLCLAATSGPMISGASSGEKPAADWPIVRYDDCGNPDRQPSVLAGGNWTFSENEVKAPLEARTVAFDEKAVMVRYEGLKPTARYRLRVVYCTERDRPRKVRLVAGSNVEIHPPFAMPEGKAQTFEYAIPEKALTDGVLELRFERVDGPNAAVAQVWLLSDVPQPSFSVVAKSQPNARLGVRVFEGIEAKAAVGAEVTVTGPGSIQAQARTGEDGTALFDLASQVTEKTDGELLIEARSGSSRARTVKKMDPVFKLSYAAPVLTPCPESVSGAPETRISLDGTWRFNPSPAEGFAASGAAKSGEGWSDIEVPGEWTMQGFSVAQEKDAGYFREFEAPAAWKGNRIKLRFDAVYSKAVVWVNGKEAGGHEGGFTPFELDVTDLVRPGAANTVALSVRNETLADGMASGSQYAAHPLGGIPRKVYLFAVPSLHLASLHVQTQFDQAYRDADMRVLVDVANEGGAAIPGDQIRFELTDPAGKAVTLAPAALEIPALSAGQTRSLVLSIPVAAPLQWDNEHPNLYALKAALRTDQKELQTVRRKFGFRQVEVRGNELFVNNHPVKLHGVCRHEVDPLRGRSLAPGQWKKDAEIFREGNVNFVRTSHYPPAEEFLEACDEAGIFVEDEAPFCWENGSRNPDHLFLTVRQTLEYVQRDRSHPSVIVWSLANESSWGPNFAASSEAVHALDPTRPLTFNYFPWDAGMGTADGSLLSVGSIHYPGPGGPAKYENSKLPVWFDEYCHLNAYNRYELETDPAVRNAWGRGFAKMYDAMWKSQGVLGGSLWAAIDDTFHLPKGPTVGYGTWGPIDGWRRPKPEYWHMKKVYSPVRIRATEVAVPEEDKPLTVEVENRHDFTNLSELRIEWKLAEESGVATADIGPRKSGALLIPVKSGAMDGESLSLKITSPRGFVVDEYLLTVGAPKTAQTSLQKPPMQKAKMTREGDVVRVEGKGCAYEINAQTGMVIKGYAGKDPVVLGGPRLMVLPLNGQGGTQMTAETNTYAPYTATCADWKADSVQMAETDAGVRIEVKGTYKEAKGAYSMVIDGAGRLRVEYRFTSRQKVNPRQTGMVFDIARGCDTLSWKRKGQWTVYPADHIGRLEGTAKAFVAGTKAGPAGPRTRPTWPWSLDSNALGTMDFRSTKENVFWASLLDSRGRGVRVASDGTQHTRSWVDGNKVRLLVADYSNAGAEGFFRSHAAAEDRPLEKGGIAEGRAVLELQP